ncbi:putative calcium-transporting ATPase 13, plasma membrane-type [Cucurbita maxima]|uniref:Calcium-transporting ATPase n=1 Tax=Cucurbita maxima TaxID=3661 RepID=A0A6J1HRB2_CUCMA|nr:putative calcium-transporting ATPase 13, plasma membrane-type [Cucurbita maxima]XP_022965554.1 putative calcium-transporting ATPase 13, plasma membrane-type [Cucurbita maxima]
MALRCRKSDEVVEVLNREERLVMAKTHKRRWKMAFAAIYFTRALISLTRKVTDRKSGALLPSLSFVTLDVQVNDDSTDSGEQPCMAGFFGVDQKVLSEMVREKDCECLNRFGGVDGLANLLKTDPHDGICATQDDLTYRTNAFGTNTYSKRHGKSFFSYVIEAFNDTTIIILLICAVLSLGFGIKQHGWDDGWYDGGSIVIAIFLVVVVSAASNFKQSRQFEKLSNERDDIKIEVTRAGRRKSVSIFELLVGDIVYLKIGDQIPADGVFLDGHSLKIDESSMTGESEHAEVNHGINPFLLSGTKVNDGFGVMMVTSVGMNTAWGEMMSSIRREINEETPLQGRLNKMTAIIGKLGLTVAVVVLLVLLVRYFTGSTGEFNGSKTRFDDVMNAVLGMVAAAVTIVVVAIPEGLPLAVTLTLAYSMKKMMADNAMVRKLSACETLGSATTICTDKTGTLTLNQMKVTEFWIGEDEIMNIDYSNSRISSKVVELLHQAVGLNTTGSIQTPASSLPLETFGSPTEKAILSWAAFDLDLNLDELKKQHEIILVETFSSEKKRSGVSTRRHGTRLVNTHWKGAAEIILAMCSYYYEKQGTARAIDGEMRRQLTEIITAMAEKSLRCIAFAHKSNEDDDIRDVPAKLDESELTLLGIVGLKDPCRAGVREAVESCRAAGVSIKMVTGDNLHTATAIAIECGILNPDDDATNSEVVVEGVKFRNYTPEERLEKIGNIRVMARSSPFDKLLMVQCLKNQGHVVAVTGDGTNDAPALHEADIGLSMGIQGTEVAKESSDIVILDDNFTSVVTVLKWGRCVYNNIQKFIQFQLTVNIAALVINFIAAVSSGKVPLTAVQLLWVNLIMDTMGALALATELPTNDLMTKTPVGRSDPLVTKIMWRNLITQAVYQVTVLLVLEFKGSSIFNVNEKVKSTLIFNTFVLCQIFNEFNARKLEKKNIFEGLHKSKLFLAIIVITLAFQVVMVEVLGRFANTERLNWGQWGACLGIAALSWPIGWLSKLIPVSALQFPRGRNSAQ